MVLLGHAKKVTQEDLRSVAKSRLYNCKVLQVVENIFPGALDPCIVFNIVGSCCKVLDSDKINALARTTLRETFVRCGEVLQSIE